MKKNSFWNTSNNSTGILNSQMLKTTIVMALTSSFLTASTCGTGACAVSAPQIPSDIQNSTQFKPFNLSNEEQQVEKNYHAWILVDNGGDNTIGENRLMSGIDLNSLFSTNDKLSFFGLITSENLKNGKLSYAYPLPGNNFVAEASYMHTNYTLSVPFPGATGIVSRLSTERTCLPHNPVALIIVNGP